MADHAYEIAGTALIVLAIAVTIWGLTGSRRPR